MNKYRIKELPERNTDTSRDCCITIIKNIEGSNGLLHVLDYYNVYGMIDVTDDMLIDFIRDVYNIL